MKSIFGSASLTFAMVAGRMMYDAYTNENERLVKVEMDRLMLEEGNSAATLAQARSTTTTVQAK